MASTRAPTAPAATHSQIEALLNFMSVNEELARGLLRGADGRIRSKRLWESLCNSLNSMGSCTKSVEQWQRVWADKKHLAKRAAGAARRSACATGGGPSVAPTLSQLELRVLSIMGKGFGEPQTEARVPAFPLSSPVRQDPAPITPTLSPASPLSQEQHSMSTETGVLPMQNQTTLNSRRARPRVRRALAADSARNRIIELEEQRLLADNRRNEVLSQIVVAITDLSNLLREHTSRNS